MRINDGLAAEAGSARMLGRANKASKPSAKATRQTKPVRVCVKSITVSSFSHHLLLSVPHIYTYPLIYKIQAHLHEGSVSFNGLAPQLAADGSEQAKHGK